MMMIAHENSSAYAPFLILRDIPSVQRPFPAPVPPRPAAPAPAAYGHATGQRKKDRQPAPAAFAAGFQFFEPLRQLFQFALQVIA
jgi:hypothetical protein